MKHVSLPLDPCPESHLVYTCDLPGSWYGEQKSPGKAKFCSKEHSPQRLIVVLLSDVGQVQLALHTLSTQVSQSGISQSGIIPEGWNCVLWPCWKEAW